MSLIKSKLKKLGSKLRPTKQIDQREAVEGFIQNLREVTGSISDLVEDLGEEFEVQIVEERSRIDRVLTKLPKIFQPKQLQEEEFERHRLTNVQSRLFTMNSSLEQIEEAMVDVPLTKEEIGKRIYDVAYPGQELTAENLDIIEAKFQELESKFFESLSAMQDQMHLVTQTLTQISDKMTDQGVVLTQMDDKLDRVETKIDQARLTLEKISKKLSQNKALLAFLLGAVIVLIGALILL